MLEKGKHKGTLAPTLDIVDILATREPMKIASWSKASILLPPLTDCKVGGKAMYGR